MHSDTDDRASMNHRFLSQRWREDELAFRPDPWLSPAQPSLELVVGRLCADKLAHVEVVQELQQPRLAVHGQVADLVKEGHAV